MAIDHFNGSISVLTLYDVADQIKLTELRRLIGGEPVSASFKHTTPEYVRFGRPPVIEPLDPPRLDTGERFDATAQYYDYGVISITLRLGYAGDWRQLKELAARWLSSSIFDDLTARLVRQRVNSIQPALSKPYEHWLSEDYYVFHLKADDSNLAAADFLREHGHDISQIVRGEVTPLADVEISEVLQASLSYYPNDLTVVGWNAAFLLDSEAGGRAAIRLLEYANSQLLQFRHYDELLTRELGDVYRFLERRGGMLAGWRMRGAAARLRTVLLDVTELTERTNNALKFVGDMYSARLYKLSATKIGVTDYQSLVEEKLRTASELYGFMIEQFHQARGFILELIVVLILIIELVLVLEHR